MEITDLREQSIYVSIGKFNVRHLAGALPYPRRGIPGIVTLATQPKRE